MTAHTDAATDGDPEVHTEREDDPWAIRIPDHPDRTDSPEYVASRKTMNTIARSVEHLMFGAPPFQDHHGGGLWLKDATGWFMVKNIAGIEWSAQFCADPKLVDLLRVNAARIYAGFPDAVTGLDIRELLDQPITDAAGIARWTDSICNASVPLPAAVVPVAPRGSGDGRVEVVHAAPGSDLAHAVHQRHQSGRRAILPDDNPLALQAFRRQA